MKKNVYEVLLGSEVAVYKKIKATSVHEAVRIAREKHAGRRRVHVDLRVMAVNLELLAEKEGLFEIEATCDACGMVFHDGFSTRKELGWPWAYGGFGETEHERMHNPTMLCFPCAKMQGYVDEKGEAI